MGEPHLLVEREGPVLVATMNRPERMNALSVEMFARMHDTDGMTEEEAMDFDRKVGLPIISTNDAKEGPRAFAEKRTPRFTRS
jgi:enoyl-CoA hydratase